jgi:hypothetical protein
MGLFLFANEQPSKDLMEPGFSPVDINRLNTPELQMETRQGKLDVEGPSSVSKYMRIAAFRMSLVDNVETMIGPMVPFLRADSLRSEG